DTLRRELVQSGHPHNAVNLVAVVIDQQHFAKPCDRIVRIGLHRRHIVPDKGSVQIDFFFTFVRQHTARIALEYLDTAPQEIRLYEVVGGGPLEILANSKFVYAARIPAGAYVLLVSIIADAVVALSIGLHDLARAVSGRVVRNNQFEISKRL